MPLASAKVHPRHTPPGIPRDSALGHALPSGCRAGIVVSASPPYDHTAHLEKKRTAYLLLRIGQTLPFLSDPQGRILHGKMLEVAAIMALLQEKHVGIEGGLDQALILDTIELGMAQSTEVFASTVRLLDLKRRVFLEPCSIGGFVGCSVFLGLVDVSLLHISMILPIQNV